MKKDVIYNIDNVKGLKKYILDNSIDLTVTSPPYDNLRTYSGFSFDFENLANELYRVTKPGGVVVWIVNDATINGSETLTSFKQALYFKEQVGFNVHDTMIYKKANPVPGKFNRYKPCFEYMFVFSKGSPKTFNPIMVKSKHAGKKFSGGQRRPNGEMKSLSQSGKPCKKHKVKENIWEYKTGNMQSTKDKIAYKHPAIFPEKLAEDHIFSWSNPGDIILDPFAGSGTALKMAKLNGRHYIGLEISEEYVDIANERLKLVGELEVV